MTIRVGPYTFEDVDYDADSDILYVRTGESVTVIGDETTEGHVLCYAETGPDRLVGIDFFNPRRTLSREGEVTVTLPRGERVAAEGIERALRAPQPR
ncbi:MAG: hypothetical protein GEU88_05410 [Solirubrobacterales bacterium]|nr:hypothetical protein [Solirubrobacterales bacterium]